METRELLHGIPLEDGALEEQLLGMDTGAVMILQFEERDGQENPHSSSKFQVQKSIQGPRAEWHPFMLRGTLLHKIFADQPRRASDIKFPTKDASWYTWWRFFTEICRTRQNFKHFKHSALGKMCKVEYFTIMIGSRSA